MQAKIAKLSIPNVLKSMKSKMAELRAKEGDLK